MDFLENLDFCFDHAPLILEEYEVPEDFEYHLFLFEACGSDAFDIINESALWDAIKADFKTLKSKLGQSEIVKQVASEYEKAKAEGPDRIVQFGNWLKQAADKAEKGELKPESKSKTEDQLDSKSEKDPWADSPLGKEAKPKELGRKAYSLFEKMATVFGSEADSKERLQAAAGKIFGDWPKTAPKVLGYIQKSILPYLDKRFKSSQELAKRFNDIISQFDELGVKP